MKRKYTIGIAIVLAACFFALTPIGQHLIAQSSYDVGGWLGLVTDTTNSSLQVSIVSTDTNLTVGGDLTVTDDATIGGWLTLPSTIVAAQSYTIGSTGKASAYFHEFTDTEASTIFLPDTPADGTVIWVYDSDGNASANNLVVATEGSDTVNESASVTFDANFEAGMFLYNSTNTDWGRLGGNLE